MELKEQILGYISFNPFCTPWEVMRQSGFSYRATLTALNELLSNDTISILDGKLKLNVVRSIPTVQLSVCPICNDKLVPLSLWGNDLIETWQSMTRDRPMEKHDFTQHHITTETALSRAGLIIKRLNIETPHIAILGDDDLTSLAMALIYPSARIAVLEADERLVAYINEVARNHKLAVKAYTYNALESLPKKYQGQFDVFFTDPAPTLDCFKLFMSRLVDAVKPSAGLRGYVSTYANHQAVDLEQQRSLTEMGLLISMIIPSFTEYRLIIEQISPELQIVVHKFPADGQISFCESMIEVTTTVNSRSVIAGNYEKSLAFLLGFER